MQQDRSVRTVVLTIIIIGMTQVCQHYAHTFEKFKFHFHYESDPTFDRLAQFVWSKNACTPKMVKIARSVLNLFKKSVFKILLLLVVVVVVVVVVVQFRQAHLKNQTRYRGETLHDDWNP